MNASEVLKQINKIYPPGCIHWWERQSQDLWQEANASWEKSFNLEEKELRDAATQAYISRINKCIEIYKQSGHKPKTLTALDAFMIGDPDRRKLEESAIYHECYKCMSPKSLSLVRDKEKYLFICSECKKEG